MCRPWVYLWCPTQNEESSVTSVLPVALLVLACATDRGVIAYSTGNVPHIILNEVDEAADRVWFMPVFIIFKKGRIA